ncbi:hypothetical protein PVAP13_1NG002673, partial [Panicum virgatum]
MIDQRCVLLDWNVRGLKNSARRKVVRDLAHDTGASIVCLQETKMQLIDRGVVVETLGQHFAEQFVFLPAVGTRGGALLAVDENYYRIVQFDVREHSVSAQLEPLMGEDQAKLQFLQELRNLRNSIPEKWLVIGDFNLILQAQDKSNSNLNR